MAFLTVCGNVSSSRRPNPLLCPLVFPPRYATTREKKKEGKKEKGEKKIRKVFKVRKRDDRRHGAERWRRNQMLRKSTCQGREGETCLLFLLSLFLFFFHHHHYYYYFLIFFIFFFFFFLVLSIA